MGWRSVRRFKSRGMHDVRVYLKCCKFLRAPIVVIPHNNAHAYPASEQSLGKLVSRIKVDSFNANRKIVLTVRSQVRAIFISSMLAARGDLWNRKRNPPFPMGFKIRRMGSRRQVKFEFYSATV